MKNTYPKPLAIVLLCSYFFVFSLTEAQNINTVAGINALSPGYTGDGGDAKNARLNMPFGLAADAFGNTYVCDVYYNVVRKIDASTHIITTYAGGSLAGPIGDGGQATSATLRSPLNMYAAPNGDLYICELAAVRKVNALTHIITTVAGTGVQGYSGDGGLAVNAKLNSVRGVWLDKSNNLYIVDGGNFRIRKVEAVTNKITTYAGTGTPGYSGDGGDAALALISNVLGITGDPLGNLYICDVDNARVRKIDAVTHIISTFAGTGAQFHSGDGGLATSAQLSYPEKIAMGANNSFFICEGRFVRKIDGNTGIISTIAGTREAGYSGDGGSALSAMISAYDMAVDINNNLYITQNSHVRKIDASNGYIYNYAGNFIPFAGDGQTLDHAVFNRPGNVIFDKVGNMYISDMENNRIRKVDIKTKTVSTIIGTGYYSGSRDSVLAIGVSAANPKGLAIDDAGNIYYCDYGAWCVRKIDAKSNLVYTVAGAKKQTGTIVGNIPATQAIIASPQSIILDNEGNLYIADVFAHIVWKVDAVTKIITIVAGTNMYGFSGDGGPATAAKLFAPYDLALDKAGNLYIADAGNYRIRKVDKATGIITTIAGNGIADQNNTGDGGLAINARFNFIRSIAFDDKGNLHIGSGNTIRKIDSATGIINTIAGQPGFYGGGYTGDGGKASEAKLSVATCITFDKSGNLYFADQDNYVIRVVGQNTLPVKLTSFTANNAGKYVRLNWQTVTEVNSDYFVVEKSNGNESFTAIGKIYCKGNTLNKQDYDLYDNTPFNGVNYYRLKQVDKDGKYIYSEIRVVSFLNDANILIYPNPVKDILVVHGLPVSGNTRITILDPGGKPLNTGTAAGDSYAVNIKNLAQGVYYLKIESGSMVNTLKFVK